jgi:two-component system sensor histidine kinase KdpD
VLKAEIPAKMPLFMADLTLMEQAVANLLLNAAVHTPEGTPIIVSTGMDEAGSRVFIAVTDHGPGLSPELRENPFQKFRRGKRAPAGGLGLGLSIVRGFVVAQGGTVVASERPGGGACFTIYLPYGPHGSVPNE